MVIKSSSSLYKANLVGWKVNSKDLVSGESDEKLTILPPWSDYANPLNKEVCVCILGE